MSPRHLIGRVALIVSCCAVATVLITTVLLVTPRLQWWHRAASDLGVYPRGTRIDLPAHVYDGAEFTALLFVRGSCDVCQETKALYAEVIRELRAIPSVKVVAVLGAPLRHEDADYASELGLDRSEYVGIELAGLNVRRVPMLVIVNRHGTILESWEGAPPLSQRSGFVATVRSSVPH